ALATVRVGTCRNERGDYEVTNAAFRMAQGDNTVVDNFHAGGILAKVDIRTGVLGRATDGAMALGPGTGWCERHPDTGAQILGRRLPAWLQVVALARRAHATAFADHVVIGWDIAILDDGPRLIEGNKGPHLDLVQRSPSPPPRQPPFRPPARLQPRAQPGGHSKAELKRVLRAGRAPPRLGACRHRDRRAAPSFSVSATVWNSAAGTPAAGEISGS